MDLISSLTSDVVNKSLDGLSQRHQAIASNLANVDTPGYHHRSVNFEANLQQAILTEQGKGIKVSTNDAQLPMKVSKASHMSNSAMFNSVSEVTPQVQETEDSEYRNDGNSVDIEYEMADLARNTQKYVALSNLQGRMLRSLRGVIQGSGGS